MKEQITRDLVHRGPVPDPIPIPTVFPPAKIQDCAVIAPEQLAEAQALGGHPSPRWSPGSCWANEGLYLYRAVRAMRPAVIVEVGRWEGCSTSHLALGCKHNDFGRVYSIDIDPASGRRIPVDLQRWISFITADVLQSDAASLLQGMPIDLLLEDGAHSPGFTAHVLRNFPARRVIVHDYFHWDCQQTVRKDCLAVFGEPHETFFEPPSDCGYACYKFDR